MLSITNSFIFEAAAQQQAATPTNKVAPGNTFSAADAQKIIDSNKTDEEKKPSTVVHLTPKSTTDMFKNNSASLNNAAQNVSNNASNAGARNSSLTSGYVNRPSSANNTRLGSNPTFAAKTI